MDSNDGANVGSRIGRTEDPIMSKCVLTPEFHQKHSLGPYYKSHAIEKRDRQKERRKTAGDKWFNMPAPELTDELKNDLKAIRMRDALDPARFYKQNDTRGLPKYFQVGKIIESPADFYSSRIPKRQRKKTIVEELLQDAEFQRYRKRKANELFKAKHQQARYYKKKSKKREERDSSKHRGKGKRKNAEKTD